MPNKFLNRLSDRFSSTIYASDEQQVVEQPQLALEDDGPAANPVGPGSSDPANWQTAIQTGLNEHQLRERANLLANIIEDYQSKVPDLVDIWESLMSGGGKHLEMYLPIIIKNLSREKLLKLSEILSHLATHAMIK